MRIKCLIDLTLVDCNKHEPVAALKDRKIVMIGRVTEDEACMAIGPGDNLIFRVRRGEKEEEIWLAGGEGSFEDPRTLVTRINPMLGYWEMWSGADDDGVLRGATQAKKVENGKRKISRR